MDTGKRVDCEQSLFCLKIRGEKEGDHESRASSKAASSARALLAASPLARDSCSPTFSPRIFEQKRDCSQSRKRGKSSICKTALRFGAD